VADGPVSRILCRTQTAKRLACAAIIPLGHDSHRDSSSLPEGFHLQWLEPPQKELSLIEPGRLSPPIWPCTTRGFPCLRCHHRSGGLLPHLFTLAKRCVLFEDVSQVSLRDATVLRSAGGLFSVALSVALRVAQALACAPHCAPWRYQARCPVKSSAPHNVKSVRQDGVRTFLPFQLCSGGFTSPLFRRNQRSPGPPANFIIPRSPCSVAPRLARVSLPPSSASNGKVRTPEQPTDQGARCLFPEKAAQSLRKPRHYTKRVPPRRESQISSAK